MNFKWNKGEMVYDYLYCFEEKGKLYSDLLYVAVIVQPFLYGI